MTGVEIRKAQPGDHLLGAELILETLYGFGPYLMGLGDNRRALSAMQAYFRYPTNRFSYRFSYIALVDGKIAGLLLVLAGKSMPAVLTATSFQMFKVYKMKEVFQFLKRAIILRDEEDVRRDEMYIAHLAVVAQYRRRGIGQVLLDLAEKCARESGLKKLSLMAELDNTPAISLYQKYGYHITKKFMHPHQIPLTGSHGYVKMIKDL